jgi:hypothetical protein
MPFAAAYRPAQLWRSRDGFVCGTSRTLRSGLLDLSGPAALSRTRTSWSRSRGPTTILALTRTPHGSKQAGRMPNPASDFAAMIYDAENPTYAAANAYVNACSSLNSQHLGYVYVGDWYDMLPPFWRSFLNPC